MSLSKNAAKLKLWLDRYKITATELATRIITRGTFGNYLTEVRTIDILAPGTFTATPYDSNVVLTWADVIHEEGYTLERSPNADFIPDTIVTSLIAHNATTYTDTTVLPLTGYHYRIYGTRPVGSDGGTTIAWGHIAKNLYTTTIAAIDASTSLIASLITDTTLTLTWTVVNNATGYILERATNKSFTADLSTVYTGALLTHNETGLTPGVKYYYRVHATKANYTTITYTSTSATLDIALIAPSIPIVTNLASTTATLTWGASVGATGYLVKRSATAGGSYVTVTGGTISSGSTVTLAITGLSADTDNYFKVTATKTGYVSATSVASALAHTTA